jgi:hypothetical protein
VPASCPGTPSPLALRGARRPGDRHPDRAAPRPSCPRAELRHALTHVPGTACTRHPARTPASPVAKPQVTAHHRAITRNLPGSLDKRFLTLVMHGWCRSGRPADGARKWAFCTLTVGGWGAADPGSDVGAARDQHPALSGPRLSQQPVQRRLLGPPATQSEPGMTVRHRPPPRRERTRYRASSLTSQPDALVRPASRHQSNQ